MHPESDTSVVKEPDVCSWHPDFSLSSPQAREWKIENDKSRKQQLNVNADQTYIVQNGDCLSTIAERALTATNEPINQNSINCEVQKLIKANRVDHPELECNQDYLKDGWSLHIPEFDANREQLLKAEDTAAVSDPHVDLPADQYPADESTISQYGTPDNYSSAAQLDHFQFTERIAEPTAYAYATGPAYSERQTQADSRWRAGYGVSGSLGQGVIETNSEIQRRMQDFGVQ